MILKQSIKKLTLHIEQIYSCSLQLAVVRFATAKCLDLRSFHVVPVSVSIPSNHFQVLLHKCWKYISPLGTHLISTVINTCILVSNMVWGRCSENYTGSSILFGRNWVIRFCYRPNRLYSLNRWIKYIIHFLASDSCDLSVSSLFFS